MRQEYVVEILPDGRAALRIALVPDERDTLPPVDTSLPPGRGVVEIPMYEEPEPDNTGVVVWKM
jgi:hypothetical protein